MIAYEDNPHLLKKKGETEMSTLTVTVKQRTSKSGDTTLEGSFQLPGSTVTKLSKKDGTTQFPNRATLNQTARRVATALGWSLEYDEPKKKAAKKSVKSKTGKTSKSKKASKAQTSAASSPAASSTDA
jgi:hypothetical protein